MSDPMANQDGKGRERTTAFSWVVPPQGWSDQLLQPDLKEVDDGVAGSIQPTPTVEAETEK